MSLARVANAGDGAASATGVSPLVEHVYFMDGRPATKQLVESLHAKIQMLEAELAQLKGGRSSVPSADSDVETSTPLANTLTVPPEPVGEPSIVERERPEPPNVKLTTTVMYRYIFDIDTSIPASEQPKDVHLSVACQWNRYLPPAPQLTRLEHDVILSRCFKYGVTWLHCMLPETFLHDMLYCLTSEASTPGEQLRLQHYTPMLHCALLAYASAFSDNPEIRSLSFRAELVRYAKQWLDYEFERPVMALVRALALLAEYHCGIGEQGAGYMYMGMSIRAARSLILLDDQDSWVSEGVAAHPEAVERDWHFWSAFCQDKIMALEFKQECDVPVPHLGVSLPSIDVESDSLPWSDELVGFPPRLTTKTFFDSCKLMVISTSVISALHGREHETHNERAAINLHLQLDTWFNHLPRELLVWARSASPLPHIITLHICYWFLLVCLHKPFYNRDAVADDNRAKAPSGTSEASGQGGGVDPIHDLSMKMVDRATHKIVQLLQMFEEQHGMRFFPRNMLHVIYECGLALLKEAVTVPFAAAKKRANALEAGNMCLRALRGTSATWSWAEQLANRLEGQLNQTGASITMQPFTSNWTTPTAENEQTGTDTSQTFYQFVHVWDPASTENSVTNDSTNRVPGMRTNPPRVGLSDPVGLGLQGVPHQDFGNPAIRGNLGETGSAHVDEEAQSYDMMSFSGTPSSSRSSYSLPPQTQQGTDERVWDPSFQ
ncbi:unnamed protein product [Rhizoctonia solani]|uniref:Xylanolytic transcriptional activator regulatory domain-containing protein n=1 Tax=Rhizoctonia solani TaxID=456999 RepID=A0A8H2XFU9_9AGAM|nr:unnamed protein product [Rhizoctonia solani]